MTFLKQYFSYILGGLVVVAVAASSALYALQTKPHASTALPVPEAMQPIVYFEIGQYYFNQDDDPDGPYDLALARQYFTAAAERNPRVSPLLWYQFGRLEFIEGNLDEAIAKFERQLEYFGEAEPNVLYMKGLAYGYKARRTNDPADWRQAELAFNNFLPYAPASPWTRVDLSWVYFAQGKYEDMKPVLEAGLEIRPDNPWLLNMYGLALLNTDESEAALKVFLKAHGAALRLTEADWGKAYPGNHPDLWGSGLAEFQSIIAKNIELASTASVSSQ